jgi:hypothetical protein
MAALQNLEKRLAAVEQRNARVEEDKAWETSVARRALVAAFTYIAVGAYFAAISIPNPWLNAVVPTAAFLLSTLTLPYFKKMWLSNRKR